MKATISGAIGRGFGYVVLLCLAFACFYPLLLVVIASFTDQASLLQYGFTVFPHKWSAIAYQAIFNDATVPRAALVSLFVTVVGTGLSLLITAATAYPLSLKKLRNRAKMSVYFLIPMLFGGGLVSTYILIEEYLHLGDTIWVYIIPVLMSPWSMFLMRNYFRDIPEEVYESARVEGASELLILFRIALPLSLPALATIGMFYAVGFWGEWQQAQLYITNPNLYTLPFLIVQLIQNLAFAQQIAAMGVPVNDHLATMPSITIQLATAVVTMGPIILLFPLLQRYYVSGLKIGAIKG